MTVLKSCRQHGKHHFGGLGGNGTSIFEPREEFAVHSARSFKPSEVLALPGNGIHWDMHDAGDAQVW
jgi:hypothetical protein